MVNKDTSIKDSEILENLKRNGMYTIPVNMLHGGLWDKSGKKIPVNPPKKKASKRGVSRLKALEIEKEIADQLKRIKELREESITQFMIAQQNIKKAFLDVKKSGGLFDFELIQETVKQINEFMRKEKNAFSFVMKDLFFWDDYFYTHSTNICITGIKILRQYCKLMDGLNQEIPYSNSEINRISVGFFLHDIGKSMLPEEILNKKGKYTDIEMEKMKTHSYLIGSEILKINKIDDVFIKNCVMYHHSELYEGEERCYPEAKFRELPEYVKVCKLADIYDAMTSKRSYQDAQNPVSVVTTLFRDYANKEKVLQLLLHSFVKSIGIYPPGSIVTLKNNQNGYVLDSSGPIIIPLTDTSGKPLGGNHDPVNLAQSSDENLKVDSLKPLMSPKEAYNILPEFLKDF
ncbi:MAG: HD domain-containing protein [Desulfobacterales bacterium]|nr:HD domain-containing protein [Desulfobacterales bacterium]